MKLCKKMIVIRQPERVLIASKKLRTYSEASIARKPPVAGSQSPGTLIEPPTDEQRLFKIESALSGLTVEDAQYLLRKVNKSLMSKSLVVST